LINKGGDIEAKNIGDETPLHSTAYRGHIEIFCLLCDHDADIEARDDIGRRPLHHAVLHSTTYRGHIEIVRLLCDHGADIEASDDIGRRPLHYATRYGHISTMKELIEVRYADINARTDMGNTALRIARDYCNNADTAAYLISHGGIM
jgi:ankyrin repeat protein